MKPKVIDVISTEEEIEDSSTDEEITTVVEGIVCKMKNVEDKPKQTKKKLSNVKAEDIIEDKPKKMSKLSNVKAEDIVQDKSKKRGETTQPTKNVVTGKDFAKLTKKALKLGATSLDYSNRKHCKYFVILNNGKKIHFGNPKYEDYLIRHDEERRKKYLARAKKNNQ